MFIVVARLGEQGIYCFEDSSEEVRSSFGNKVKTWELKIRVGREREK
jgi:hypothetical protein